jgi:nitrile hydratase accessory protein
MQTRFEHFAVTSMIGSTDRPPRADGALKFAHEWERTAFGVALALSRDGHFEWEEFRQRLIATIGDWEGRHEIDDPTWNYYDQWLAASNLWSSPPALPAKRRSPRAPMRRRRGICAASRKSCR